MSQAVRRLREQGFAGELLQDEPMRNHCSLRVGGPARLLAVASSADDLGVITGFLEEERRPWVLIGGGTNVVFTNGRYEGCVLKLGDAFSGIERVDGTGLVAGASASLPALVSRAGEEGLAGLECLAGIPGTVGGAVAMNAGTRAGEVAASVEEVQVYRAGQALWLKREEMGFSYRQTSLARGEIVLATRFRMVRSTPEEVRRKTRGQIRDRRRSQPQGVPSAGCWFRNPEGESAGRLIDRAGLKGVCRGGASVSKVHANFLVNTGSATAKDFLALAEDVRETVLRRFGVRLEEEVRVIDA